MPSKSTVFKSDLHQRYWSYIDTCHPEWDHPLDRRHPPEKGPVVFRPVFADFNVIFHPQSSLEMKQRLLDYIPPYEHHKWFRSMNSSQALAQSVFGNLAIHDCLEVLSDLLDDDGSPLFGGAQLSSDHFRMERKVGHLGEPQPTSLDVYFRGAYQVAVECKFTETEVGSCSHVQLKPGPPSWCDGNYTLKGRAHRCPLITTGVKYWQFVPELFHWKDDADIRPCPLYRNYQLSDYHRIIAHKRFPQSKKFMFAVEAFGRKPKNLVYRIFSDISKSFAATYRYI